MCQFKSAIVLRDESMKGGFRLLMSPWTESHSDLVAIHKLKDGARLSFARVEFTPAKMENAYLPEKYTLRIDEERTPEWFDADMKDAVAEKMRTYIKGIIVAGDVELLIGGQFVIAPGAKVERANGMVINAICGGTVSAIWGGTVSAIWGGTVSEIWGGTVSEIRGGTVSAIWGGTVSAIWGGTVSAIWGGTVSEIRGGTVAKITDEWRTPVIGKIHEEANVRDERKNK